MRDEIINASLSLFSSKGIKFTMDDLSNELGMSKRTLYSFISSKEALINLVVDYVFIEIKKKEKEVLLDDTLDDLEKLKKLLIVLPNTFKNIDYTKTYQIGVFYPRIHKKIEERLEGDWEPTIDLINKCIETGLIRKVNVTLLKNMVTASIENLLDNNFLADSGMTYDETLHEIVNIIFSGLEIKK